MKKNNKNLLINQHRNYMILMVIIFCTFKETNRGKRDLYKIDRSVNYNTSTRKYIISLLVIKYINHFLILNKNNKQRF